MWDTLVAAFVSWSEAADTFSVAWSDVVVAVAAVPVCVTLTRTVDPASVINACFTVVSAPAIASVTSWVTWAYVVFTVLTGPVQIAHAATIEIEVSVLDAVVAVEVRWAPAAVARVVALSNVDRAAFSCPEAVAFTEALEVQVGVLGAGDAITSKRTITALRAVTECVADADELRAVVLIPAGLTSAEAEVVPFSI